MTASRLPLQDGRDASPAAELQSEVPCTAVQFTPAGSHCVAGYADGSLRLYDMRHNTIMWSVGRHPAPVAAVLCHPDQPLIMSASRCGLVGNDRHAYMLAVARAFTEVLLLGQTICCFADRADAAIHSLGCQVPRPSVLVTSGHHWPLCASGWHAWQRCGPVTSLALLTQPCAAAVTACWQ